MCLVQNMIVFTVLVLGLGPVFSAPTQDGAGHQDGEGHQDLMGAMVRTFLLFNFADKSFNSNVNFVFERSARTSASLLKVNSTYMKHKV